MEWMESSIQKTQRTFYGEYKKSLLAKKNNLVLHVSGERIQGVGLEYYDKKLAETHFNILYGDVEKIYTTDIVGQKCLVIEYYSANAIDRIAPLQVVLMNLNGMDEAEVLIVKLFEAKKEKLRQEEAEKAKKREFFFSCINFHIKSDGNPYYELQNEGLRFSGIYIDKSRNLNFLNIDGNTLNESNACVPYEKIHYYERAGNIHYTTDLNAQYLNFGGSYVGPTVSKMQSTIGGLLFGPMGMATGALWSYQPAEVKFPDNYINFSSEIRKIDDRSVILNYYSDAKAQFMDIELPADMFNFLQTYLPEKRHDIALELEKDRVLSQYSNDENLKTIKESGGDSTEAVGEESPCMEQFAQRMKKLKIMHDTGVLSDEEFCAEKNRILNEL